MKCRGMEFEEKPDYNLYVRSLKKTLLRSQEEEDYVFDWMRKKNQDNKIEPFGRRLMLVREEATIKKCYEPFEKKVELE